MNTCPNTHKPNQKAYLLCPVNTLGVMGAGLALAVSQVFIDASFMYKKFAHRLRGGQTLLCDDPKLGYDGVLFVATKEDWRNPSKLEYIDKIGRDMRKWIVDRDKHIFFYIPKIGAGLGGLDWNEVREVLERQIGGLTDCYTYIERA